MTATRLRSICILFALFTTHLCYGGSGMGYHEIINKAELDIVSGDYKSSLGQYLNAFSVSENNFASDIFNASVCAVKLNDQKTAMELCQVLARKGVGSSFFIKNSIYASITKSAAWPLLLKEADEAKDSFQRSSGYLSVTLDSLFRKDQEVNHIWSEAPAEKRRAARNDMDSVYDLLSKSLKQLLDSVGFVSEFKVGARVKQDTVIDNWFPYYVIIVHNYQARMTGDTLFSPVLRRALGLNLIKPAQFAAIQDFGGNISMRENYRSTQYYIQYNCNIYQEDISIEMMREIDLLRASIQLESLSDNLKKIVFGIQHPNSIFILHGRAARYMNFADKKSEQFFLDSHKLLIENVCR